MKNSFIQIEKNNDIYLFHVERPEFIFIFFKY